MPFQHIRERKLMTGRLLLLASALSCLLINDAILSAAKAEDAYEFAPPPGRNYLRVYRVNKSTGEMGACQFAAKQNTVGNTICFPPGEGGGPQAQGSYGLVSSNLAEEGGVFRVNRQTGEMQVCYVLDSKVVCAPLGQ
jgi:hypothetical protein